MKKIFLSLVALVATVGMLNAQRTWAYDLNLEANDGSYKFVFTASTDATAANLVFLNADGTEAGKVAVSVVKGENAVELTAAQIPGTGVLNWAVELTGAAIDVATVLTDASDKYLVFFINDNIKTFDGDGELRLTIMATLAQGVFNFGVDAQYASYSAKVDAAKAAGIPIRVGANSGSVRKSFAAHNVHTASVAACPVVCLFGK